MDEIAPEKLPMQTPSFPPPPFGPIRYQRAKIAYQCCGTQYHRAEGQNAHPYDAGHEHQS